MHYTPDYTIALPDQSEVRFLFKTWGFRELSRKLGFEFSEFARNVVGGRLFQADHLPTLLLVAHETWCKYTATPFTANDLDACDWVDTIGGPSSEKIRDIYRVFVHKLTGIPFDTINVLVAGEGETPGKPTKPSRKRS